LIVAGPDELALRKCRPCGSGVPPLPRDEIQRLLALVPRWELSADGTRISRSLRARDFLTALEFFRHIADIAEAEDHHPDLHLTGYRNVLIALYTHAIGGLSENDFILAAKIDLLPVELKE
jgi:4a-hydroxytetrahydrobiopterin dehydratase